MSWIWQHASWPRLSWETAALTSELVAARHAQGELLGKARALGVLDAPENQVEPIVRDAVGTAAIEGERPSPESVRSSVLRRLHLPTAGLPVPTRSEDGLVQVLLDATQQWDALLDSPRLCSWHAALFPSEWSELRRIRVGAFRDSGAMRVVSGREGREVVHFEAPPAHTLASEVDAFLSWFSDARDGIDGLVRAAVAHLWFVTLHPFDDGNGRIARAVTDLALAQADRVPVRLMSLSARIMDVRGEYYAGLESAQRGDIDVTRWVRWHTEQIREAATAASRRLDDVVWRHAFWERHRTAPLNERQHKVLARMLDEGPGGFEGGMTNRKYVSLTGCSRATAQRDLEALVDAGCLRPLGAGRSRRYQVVE